MTRLTTDPADPKLGHGSDDTPVPQQEVYLVLPETDTPEFIRPIRNTYYHTICGTTTSMGQQLAETYARDPKFYGSTYCCTCQKHRPVGEFFWDGTTEKVGS